MSARASAAAIAAAKELAAKGYLVTVEQDRIRIYRKPAADRGVKPIRCATCRHLRALDLPRQGKVCNCRLGWWKNRRGADLWYNPSFLFTPPTPLARIAEACTDHEPAPAEVD